MDKLLKALKKLSKKEQALVSSILQKLESDNFDGLDIKKLKSSEDVFRVRKGDLRILYQIKDDKIMLVMIDRRSEKTYKKF